MMEVIAVQLAGLELPYADIPGFTTVARKACLAAA
jgi:hypothetical protein